MKNIKEVVRREKEKENTLKNISTHLKAQENALRDKRKFFYMKIELYANQEFYSSLFYVHFKA